eukprot:COSAG02_NODE_20_length_53673_cov_86.864841_6_plen_151_part_00
MSHHFRQFRPDHLLTESNCSAPGHLSPLVGFLRSRPFVLDGLPAGCAERIRIWILLGQMMDRMGWSCCWLCLARQRSGFHLAVLCMRSISVTPDDFAQAWYLMQCRSSVVLDAMSNLELSPPRHILLERAYSALPKTKHQCFPGDECSCG